MNRILHRLKSRVELAGSTITPIKDSPDVSLGELFQDVQFRRIYPDGMTFVDLVPARKLRSILKTYKKQRHDPSFDLQAFVHQHFKGYVAEEKPYTTNPHHTLEQHISELWGVLRREAYKNTGSLIALPYPYIVPGGRFSAQWYWDSYFTMLGLAADNQWDTLEGMLKNFAFMVRKFGRVPSGNRTYYLSRSQPPFFCQMVRLLADHEGKTTLVKYLPYMIAEHRFWMKGAKNLSKGVYRRVVKMPDGEVLNRYFDNNATPRPESYKEDIDTALLAPQRTPSKVYLDIRAAAESGWDFSSRWLKDEVDLPTICTTEIVPVDLNCFMYTMEQTIADAYTVLKQAKLAGRYRAKAERRAETIRTACWNDDVQYFYDFDFVEGKQTPHLTLAGVTPLYAGVATAEQAKAVAGVIREKFLKSGGLVTTLVTNGQQWDSPNGWAPLHWMTVQGLRKYGYHELADDIKSRWLTTVKKVYAEQGKLVEKYNVVDPTMVAGGGEYGLQDGFGWTNGVTLAFLREEK